MLVALLRFDGPFPFCEYDVDVELSRDGWSLRGKVDLSIVAEEEGFVRWQLFDQNGDIPFECVDPLYVRREDTYHMTNVNIGVDGWNATVALKERMMQELMERFEVKDVGTEVVAEIR